MTARPTSAELATMTSREIVVRAAADHMLFKHASEILERREPDDQAARALVEAYESGRAPAWLAAHLLGCLRVRWAYGIVRSILVSAPGLGAESYGGVAMVRIAGADSRGDLLDLLRRAQHRRSREGAAYGLGELHDPTVAPAIVAAIREGLIRRLCAGSVIAQMGVPSTELIAWLGSADEAKRTTAIDAVFHLSARLGGLRDFPLARAARDAMLAGTVHLDPNIRAMLEERIAALLESA